MLHHQTKDHGQIRSCGLAFYNKLIQHVDEYENTVQHMRGDGNTSTEVRTAMDHTVCIMKPRQEKKTILHAKNLLR